MPGARPEACADVRMCRHALAWDGERLQPAGTVRVRVLRRLHPAILLLPGAMLHCSTQRRLSEGKFEKNRMAVPEHTRSQLHVAEDRAVQNRNAYNDWKNKVRHIAV